MRFILAAATVMALLIAERTASAQDGPVIVSEQIQRLALQYSVAERLDIEWGTARPQDTGDYMGTLAAGEELAREIAEKNGRTEPGHEDYVSALLSLCFISNKPPQLSEYRPRLFPAYYSEDVRTRLTESLGPIPYELPERLMMMVNQENVAEYVQQGRIEFPESQQDYFNQVIDLSRVPER